MLKRILINHHLKLILNYNNMRAWQKDYAMDCKSIYEGLIPSALSKLKKEKNMKFDLEKLIEQLTDLLTRIKI